MSAIRYIIEVIVCSGLFLVAYRWLLARKIGFGLCRAFIMVSMLLAVAIPAMNVPLFPEKTLMQQTVLTGFDFFEEELGETASDIDAVVTETYEKATTGNVPSPESFGIMDIAAIAANVIYLLVAIAALALTAYNVIKIKRLRRRSKLTHIEEYTLAEHEEIRTPFSFLKTIFMGYNYEPDERRQILTHEASHVRHRHSFERISLSVLRSIFWFNPFFWMAEKDLEEVQEWEADKDVLNEGYELNTYRTTIFKQLFGYNPDISCGLNHSLTKQRFIMMTQSRRGKGAWIRLAATLPIFAGLFLAFGCGTKEAKTEVSTNLTNGTEDTYIDMCPPCDATYSNSFNAGKAGRSHTGIDYVLNEGDPVYAVADGEVSAITRDDSNGLMLTLKHADGYETRYAHLSKVDIASKISFKGKDSGHDISGNSYHISTTADHTGWTINGKVFKGQLIGYGGSTGRAKGAHLHFELRRHDIPIDPSQFFTSDKPATGPFQIYICEGPHNPVKGKTGNVFCNGVFTEKEEIGKAVQVFFAGKPMYEAVVHIEADGNVATGIITDIKQQLRQIGALRVRYITDENTIDKRLPMPAVAGKVETTSIESLLETVKRRNIVVIKVNANDQMLLGSRYIKESLRDDALYRQEIDRLKSYLTNPNDDPKAPESEMRNITMPDGSVRQFRVSKGIVSFQHDRGTSYEGYTKTMKLITTAYNEIREDFSSEVFGKPLAELSDQELMVVYLAVPMNVSEAEPKDVPARK